MYKILADILEKQGRFENPAQRNEVIKWLKTELTYTSNHIEGNTLTREETALTIEEGITSGSKPLKDYIEAKNHAEAFEYILSLINEEKISYEKVIFDIHSIILNGINDEFKGRYRTVRVRISGSNVVLPNPLKVPELMKRFSEKLDQKKDSILKAIEAHYKLVEIHPFIDGNGRTARLLMSLILLRSQIFPILIQPKERKRYLSHINERNLKGKIFPYYNYMLKLLDKSLKIYDAMFGETSDSESELLTIKKFAEFCGVPISTVRYYLKINKLQPRSYTNAGYMLFDKNQASVINQNNKSGKSTTHRCAFTSF